MYYSTVFSIKQHKIADFATREGAPLPSPKGEGGPAGPDEGVSFRAADHKRAAEQAAPLSKGDSPLRGEMSRSDRGARARRAVTVR